MIVLGIESTAHTFGIGILDSDSKKVLANRMSSYTSKTGGMIPFEVAQHHIDACDTVLAEALAQAEVSLKDVQLISFSQSPGIGNCLRIGAMFARSLSLKHNIPIIGVNHCVAHLEIGKMLTPAQRPALLYVSGANTQVIALEQGKYRVFGETLDIGIGNFLDTFARELGLGFPGGAKIYDEAQKHIKKFESLEQAPICDLPYNVKGMDISLGGLLTNLKQKHKQGIATGLLCHSLQEVAFAMVVEVAERAMAHLGTNELLLGGGVACSKRLQEMCEKMCKDRNATLYVLPNQFNVDNGAMIAWLGFRMYDAGVRMAVEQCSIDPYLRTDDVAVIWD